jgi:hypothetical protein
MTCHYNADRTFVICTTPMREIHRETVGVRWCFVCRKRREFVYVVTATIEPSYYDPNPAIECTVCGRIDGDLFPGRSREWVA